MTHNEYLWLLVDTGFLGLGLYAVFAAGVWRRLRKWLSDYGGASLMWEGVFAFLLLFIVYHLLVGMFWDYSRSVSGSWLYLSFMGSVLGLTRPTQAPYSLDDEEGRK